MLTVVSITSVSLWENQIPDKILEYLYTNTSFKNRMEIQYIPRHHSEVLHIFIHFYGQYLDTCPYAKLFSFPDKYAMFYRVEQAPCYKSCKYPERVVLFKNHYLEHEKIHMTEKNNMTPSQIQGQINLLKNFIKYDNAKRL